MIFVHVYNYCIEIGLLNEMKDKDVIILFMKLLSKVLNQHDIITLDSILNGESFHGSCVTFLSNFQNKLCHTSITDNEQLLEVIQGLLKTNANLCLLSMPPPIIPGLMNIDKDNQKCDIHYFPIISELIIKLENKENMSDDECISKSDQFVYIVEIICGYHHYNLSFWSIYPSQSSDPDNEESSFDLIDIESNKDDDSTDFEAVSLDHSEDSDSELNQQYVNIFWCDDTTTKYEKHVHTLKHNSCLSILNESPEIVRVSVPNNEDSQLEGVIDDEFNYFDQNISRSRNPSFSTSASTPITHRASPSYSCVLKNSSSGDSLLSPFIGDGDKAKSNMHSISPSPSYFPISPPSSTYFQYHKNLEMMNNHNDELIVNLGRTRFNSSGSNNNGGKRDRNKDNNNHTQNELDNDDEDEKKHEGIKLNVDAPEFTPANQGKKDNISEPNKLVSIDENEPMPILCINSSNSSDETELVPSSNHNRYNNGKYDVKDEPKKRPEVLTNPQINDDCKYEEKETSPDNDSIAILNVAAPAFTPTNNLPRTLSINGTFLSNQGQYLSGYQHLNENEQKQNNFQCRPYRSNRTQRKNKKGKNGKGKPSRSRYITKLNDNNIYSYEPRRDIRIESFIWVPAKFTEETLPSSIRETFSNLYKYLDKSTAMQYHFQRQLQFDGEKIRIFNYDLHDKSTNEVLYFVAQSQKRRNGYEWKLVNKLFTKEEIMVKYRIRSFELPQSSRINSEFGNMMNIQKQIMAQHASICTKLTEKEWQRIIPIHNNEYSTQKRMTYSMTPQMFKQAIKDCIDSQNGQAELIPIVMFYGDKFKLCFIHIIQLDDHINIGISYIYNQQKQCIEINGIHLKKDRIQQQHELAVPGCAGNCRCLNGFVSCIDVLHIGNPDDAQNKLNGKKHEIDAKNEEIKRLENELAKCKCKIQPQSNHPNSNISDSV